MIRYVLVPGISLALTVATSTAIAQTAHVHGKGQVNIAIEGDHLFMELESPGADIVGFEHEARSDAEKEAVKQAIAKLGDPMMLMRFDADAGCEVHSASAGIEGEHDEHDEHDEHKSHEGEEAHGAFVAKYEIECDDMDALDSIEFTYFNEFSNAQSLDIVVIDGSGQSRSEVDRANPVLKLKK